MLAHLMLPEFPSESPLEGFVQLARDICDAPTALISLVDEGDEDGHRIETASGLGLNAALNAIPLWDHAIRRKGLLVIPDAAADPRLADSMLVREAPGARFCVVVPFETFEGSKLGMLCVIDTRPRPKGLDKRQTRMLTTLAAQAATVIESRRALAMRDTKIARLDQSMERLRLAFKSAGLGLWDWNLERGLGWWCPNVGKIFGVKAGKNITCEKRLSTVHPDDRERVDREVRTELGTGDAIASEYRVLRPDGEVRWISSCGLITERRDDRATRMTGIIFDITDRKAGEDALRASEQQMRMVLESVSDGFYALDRDWRFTLLNRSAELFFDMPRNDVVGRSLWEVMPQLENSIFERNYRLVTEEQRPITFEVESILRPGRTIEVRAAPQESGGIAVSFSDISERRLLINELNHRVKNTLAVVQSMARQSFRGGADPAASRAFEGRLMALSAAHDLLTRANWEGVGLRELIDAATGPFRTEGGMRVCDESGDVRLTPKMAVSLALALHELSTNAVKYGALSNDSGRVSIDWRVDLTARRLRVRWAEAGGPPVRIPARRGFGSRMIEHGLPAELNGEVRLDFHPEGVVCEIGAALAADG